MVAPIDCILSENICTIPKAVNPTYNQAPRMAYSAQGTKTMHWLQMFLLAWLSVGMVTLIFLFWVLRRSAAAVKDPIKFSAVPPQRTEFVTNNLSNELRSA